MASEIVLECPRTIKKKIFFWKNKSSKWIKLTIWTDRGIPNLVHTYL